MCKKHDIKGTRIETKSKVWKKRKYDYGYVTTKKVTYSCSIGIPTDTPNDILAGRNTVTQKTSQRKGHSGLGSDNSQRDNTDGITRISELCLKEKVI